MKQKEEVVEKLNELIFQFEESTSIVNYAIIFNNKIVLSPNATHFKKENVDDFLKSINIEKLEKNFQKGNLTSLEIEFDSDTLFLIKCTPQIHIIASPKKVPIKNAKPKLIDFAIQIRGVIRQITKPETVDEAEEEINQSLANLDTIIKELKIPKFETFKRLVKFAIPFKKE